MGWAGLWETVTCLWHQGACHSFMVLNEFFSVCMCESECKRRVGVPCKRLLVKKMEQKIPVNFIRAE